MSSVTGVPGSVRNKSESLQIRQPVMIEDFEFAGCSKNIADPHEDFGVVTEWCA
jgi:hypothetical protein